LDWITSKDAPGAPPRRCSAPGEDIRGYAWTVGLRIFRVLGCKLDISKQPRPKFFRRTTGQVLDPPPGRPSGAAEPSRGDRPTVPNFFLNMESLKMPSWASPRRCGDPRGDIRGYPWTVECEIFRIRLNNSVIWIENSIPFTASPRGRGGARPEG
jgi:hypothetical protein